ncbi:DNA internalization-related competence protein ComEC/Rec2 [Ornithinibacillus californiensis]|uniref:DNA internalization-related competence protein ComEC/Rec2 n=1 Tax=Ornithinibacillus californiensis TaxID=161536 RepID=UPI00064DF812|nr:DNA internalization-related competence protein ComEC/Rec2 [Ornithinibacillus californiensis]
MKGYWYIPALSVVCSGLTIVFDSILFFVVLVCWLSYLYKSRRLEKLVILISLASYLFFLLYIPPIQLLNINHAPQEMNLIGEIISPISLSETLLRFDIQEVETKHKIRVSVFSPNNSHSALTTIQSGAMCNFQGEITIPDGSGNPGQFDYQKYLASMGIYYEMISTLDEITCSEENKINWIYQVRGLIKGHISEQISLVTSGWINALVLGDDSQIDDQTTELFQRWGLSHLLAISGLHIGLVVGLLYLSTVRIGLFTKEKAQLLILMFLPVYAVLAGGAPSVWRASLMVIIVILIQKLKVKLTVTDIISITCLALIMADPYIIYQIGFQLSFIVTFGIILSKQWLLEGNLLTQMLKLSFISQFMIMPLQFLYFYHLNPLSVLLNVIVVPYFTFFVIPLMFVLVIIAPLRFIQEPLDILFSVIHENIFVGFIEIVDQIAYFPWYTGSFPLLTIIIYYALLIAMMGMIQNGRLRQAFIYGISITLLLLILVIRPYLSSYGSVTMLDIGQGDAIVIELPFRKGVFLVDAGAKVGFGEQELSDANYRRIIKPFLQYKGIQKIDAIFISHEDGDHAGSVHHILEDFFVENIVVSEYFQLDEDLLHANTKSKLIRVKAGQTLDIKGKRFTILSPRVDKKGSNENSLVFLSEFGKQNWLFTGDIDKETERQILQTFPELNIDILKVAHHGSNTSSDSLFISKTQPNYALISVGKNNRYGHPSTDVLELLKKQKVKTLRTDESGAITYRFTKNSGTFYLFKP